MDKEKTYIACGDGECQFTNRCRNYTNDEEKCYVCCFNTTGTSRDYFDAKSPDVKMNEEERDMIES